MYTESAYGLGRHTWMVEQDDRHKQLEVCFPVPYVNIYIYIYTRTHIHLMGSTLTYQAKLLLASEILHNAAQAVIKVSLLLQYRRIFRGKWTRLASLVLYIFVVLWCIVSIVLNSLACMPLAVLSPMLGDTCLSSLMVWTLTSAINIVTTFAVVVVPIPATWALQLPRKMRLILTILFGLGLWYASLPFFSVAISYHIIQYPMSLKTNPDTPTAPAP